MALKGLLLMLEAFQREKIPIQLYVNDRIKFVRFVVNFKLIINFNICLVFIVLNRENLFSITLIRISPLSVPTCNIIIVHCTLALFCSQPKFRSSLTQTSPFNIQIFIRMLTSQKFPRNKILILCAD